MQTLFDRFEQRIIWRLEDIQSPDLVGIHTELAVLQKAIEDLYDRLFPAISIFKEIQNKDIIYI